jgi:hypothetical protein
MALRCARDTSPFPRPNSIAISSAATGDHAIMSAPLVVTIPHRLGKAEALNRIKFGLGRAKTEYSHLLRIDNDSWEGDRLTFAAAALGQRAHGTIDVTDTNVRLEVTLPWLLARFAHAVQRVVGQKVTPLLEKK